MNDEKNMHVHVPTATLAEIKQYLNENYKDGCYCPACNQRVQMYKRKLASTMAFCLIKFVLHQRKNQNQYTKFTNILNAENITPSQRADWQKLVYFRLIQSDPDVAGMYRITPQGFDFVQGNILMPKYANVLNGKVYGYSMEQIHIKKALTTKFDLNELLNKN